MKLYDDMSLVISRHYRNLIRTNQLAPGSRLPATQVLAADWKTHPPVVQAAMASLVKEGLLARKPGVGTVVLDSPGCLTRIGLLASPALITQVDGAYTRSLTRELEKRIALKGRSCIYVLRTESDDPSQYYLPGSLQEMAAKRDIQALIAPNSAGTEIEALLRLPVPVAVCTGYDIPNRISFDLPVATERGLGALKSQGCRSVGIILMGELELVGDPLPVARERSIFGVHLRQTAAALGLELRDAWMVTPTIFGIKDLTEFEKYGYRAFNYLWDQPGPKPDGLIVVDDIASRGVLLAIMQRRLEVPQDLRVAFCRNSGIDYICPVPATFIEWDVGAIAQALITQVELQYEGHEVSPILITPNILEHNPNCTPQPQAPA